MMGTLRTDPRRTGLTPCSKSTKQSNDGFSRFDDLEQHSLLPGIPDEVTLEIITPKLPWKTFFVLSSVSLGWRRAIQSRQVYNARVRSQATEPLVVINCVPTRRQTQACDNLFGLYSVRDKSFHPLPRIPNFRYGTPSLCQCFSMDGRIYALGGFREDSMEPLDSLYVMDLAGQRQWERCKSMRSARRNSGVGGFGKKIYVFGGYDRSRHFVCGGEVYDPESNTWNPIRPMLHWKGGWVANHRVTAVGEELLLFDEFERSHHWRSKFFLAYHPDKEEYRKVVHVERYLGAARMESLFTAQGQLHSMTSTGICVYDMERNSWTPRHSFSTPEITHAVSCVSVEWSTVAADNELVTLVTRLSGSLYEVTLLQSVGFGGQQETIEWRKIECPLQIVALSPISLIRL